MLKLARYYRPYIITFLGIAALTLVQVLSNLQLPRVMSQIVDVGIVEMNALIASGAATGSQQVAYILGRGAVMLGFALAGLTATAVSGLLAARSTAALARILREELFTRTTGFSFPEYSRFSASSLIIRATSDVVQVQQASFLLMRLALIAPLMGIGAVIMALRTNAQLSWIIAGAVPLIILTVSVAAYFAIPLFRIVQEKTDRLNQVAREGLTGVRVIRAFNRQGTQRQRFSSANAQLTDTTIRVNNIMVTLMPVISLILQVTTVAIVWFGAPLIDAGTVQIGALIAFLQYATMLLTSLLMLVPVFIVLSRANVSAERIAAVLDTEPAVSDPAAPVSTADGTPPSVSFQNVTFFHEGAEQPSLADVTFTASAGTTTAIIGSTGSGKSTILNLIERLYDASTGLVSVDGVDVRDLSQSALRERIGFVPQRPLLFSGTVRSNLQFGKPDATDDEMLAALKAAQAMDFIAEEGGLDAPVSQGGTNFSGGQRQRLSIARALVRRPRIYLFDDSFSALDLRTDARLRQALPGFTDGAVSIVVGQRISSIKDADQIIVLESGRIAGIGTHEELLRGNRVYREIAESQLTPEELER